MELVAARLGDDRDERTAGAADLGRQAAGGDFDLLDAFKLRPDLDAAGRGALAVDAVDLVGGGAGVGAVDAAGVRGDAAGGPGGDVEQVGDVAVEGQAAEQLGGNDAGDLVGLQVDRGRRADDRDLLLQLVTSVTRLTVYVWPASTLTSARLTVLKPVSSAVIV